MGYRPALTGPDRLGPRKYGSLARRPEVSRDREIRRAGRALEALSSSSMMKVTRRAVVSSSLRRPERERPLTAYGIMGEECQLIYSWGTMERVSVVDASASSAGKEA